MAKMSNLEGRRFGRLVVGALLTTCGYRWLCTCDCGNITSPHGSSLVSGKTRSCGCLQKQQAGRANARKRTPEGYRTYSGRLQGSPHGLEQKQKEFQKQRGLCALCSMPLDTDFRKAYWEHNHATTQFRGLVHPRCNTVIGYVETCPELIEKAKAYLNGR